MSRYRTDVQKYHWTYISGIADVVNAYFLHSDNSLSRCSNFEVPCSQRTSQ